MVGAGYSGSKRKEGIEKRLAPASRGGAGGSKTILERCEFLPKALKRLNSSELPEAKTLKSKSERTEQICLTRNYVALTGVAGAYIVAYEGGRIKHLGVFMWKKTVLFVVVMLMVVGCGSSETSSNPGVGGSGNQAASNRDGQVKVSGHVFMDNDLDRPVVDAVVLMIPHEQFGSIFMDQGRERPFDHRRFDPVTLDADAIRRYAVEYATTDASGSYEFSISPGRYVSCLANVVEPRPTGSVPATFGHCKGAGMDYEAGKMYFDSMSWEGNGISDVSFQ
jgi:hypothetical protein